MGDDTLPHRWLLGLHHDIGNGIKLSLYTSDRGGNLP
eukprot:CAMPEP_0177547214 /NCGR_PEP_ID=MMETSP0369-20130122/63701_1 /TAXON_ID=447022 ORGANISM="Scrippsiella hangoei-like, Strain SHHI-4" /NCGR_SAMPLE_ID=MMETSP0369 /ASSEMBLY_ACC=CAM_ASM_000364 /LENGTH=36 /DNA_ID= /DNA_START= /DNA_END= /DNA_ORIENTATION=